MQLLGSRGQGAVKKEDKRKARKEQGQVNRIVGVVR